MKRRNGLTMLEVLIALVVLAIIATLFGQTTRIAQKTSGKSVDWMQEGIVIEKTLENLRIGHTLATLRQMDSGPWTDSSGQYHVVVKAVGTTPTDADCPGYPVSNLAGMTVTARRRDFRDSVVVKTFLWVP